MSRNIKLFQCLHKTSLTATIRCVLSRSYSYSTGRDLLSEDLPDLSNALGRDSYLKDYLQNKIQQYGFIRMDIFNKLEMQLKNTHICSQSAATQLILHSGRLCAELKPSVRIKAANNIFFLIGNKSTEFYSAYFQTRLENCDWFSPMLVQQNLVESGHSLTPQAIMPCLAQYCYNGHVDDALNTISTMKESSFEVPSTAWGYLAHAYCLEGKADICHEVVHKQLTHGEATWHLYLQACMGYSKVGKNTEAVDMFCKGVNDIGGTVDMVLFVQMLETLLKNGAYQEGNKIVTYLSSYEPQLFMHAVHHLAPCPDGIKILHEMQKRLPTPILGNQMEIENTAFCFIWQCLVHCDTAEELWTYLMQAQVTFVNLDVLGYALETSLTNFPGMAEKLLVYLKREHICKDHYFLPLLLNESVNIDWQNIFTLSESDFPQRLMQLVNEVIATETQVEQHWWFGYMYLTKLKLYDLGKDFLVNSTTLPQVQNFMDTVLSPRLKTVFLQNSFEIVNQCQVVHMFPMANLLKVLIIALCDYGDIEAASKHAVNLHTQTGHLDIDLQLNLLQSSLINNCQLSDDIFSLLSCDVRKLENQMKMHNPTAVIATVQTLLEVEKNMSDNFLCTLVDRLPQSQYTTLAHQSKALNQHQHLVITKKILQNFFESNPDEAYDLMMSLCSLQNKIFAWCLVIQQFCELCLIYNQTFMFERLLTDVEGENKLFAKVSAYLAFAGAKNEGNLNISAVEHTRQFHLIILYLSEIIKTHGSKHLVRQLLLTAKKRNDQYLFETIFSNLVAVGYKPSLRHVFRNLLSPQNISNVTGSVYRTVTHAEALMEADQIMRSFYIKSPKWESKLNFYLFRQALYLMAKDATNLDKLYPYLLNRYNSFDHRKKSLEYFKKTRHWHDILSNAMITKDFEDIYLEVNLLKRKKQKSCVSSDISM